MDELRQQVARGDYAVDSRRVAGSLVAKMKLIRLGRRRIATPAPAERRDHPHAA